jgi:hypothetical protein
MILKRQVDDTETEKDVWVFIDKIDSARPCFTRELTENGEPGPFSCHVTIERQGEWTTLDLTGEAYLLSDSGKTIERIH